MAEKVVSMAATREEVRGWVSRLEEGASLSLFPPNTARARDHSTGPPAHCLILTFCKEKEELNKGWEAGLSKGGVCRSKFLGPRQKAPAGMPGSKRKLSNYLVW